MIRYLKFAYAFKEQRSINTHVAAICEVGSLSKTINTHVASIHLSEDHALAATVEIDQTNPFWKNPNSN